MKYYLLLSYILLPLSVIGQKYTQVQLHAMAEKYMKNSFPEFVELLSLPNDANHPEDIEKNMIWCESAFQSRNFTTTRIQTASLPLLLAERKVRKAKKTVLVYLQIDGQPTDTSRWFQKNPFIPVLKKQNVSGDWETIQGYDIESYDDDWRIFARSASDAKGSVAMFLAALDAIAESQFQPNYNLKVIMDFEEELGSPSLPLAVVENAAILKADMLIIFDGPLHPTNQPTLKFGARGIATLTLTTYGPVVAQHSGHYGNYVPNPALRLSKLLATMKDDKGVVIIPGYYDGISIKPETRKILEAVPDDEDQMRDQMQLGSTDKVGQSLQEAIQYPSLNIRGMQSGWIGKEARTIIPAWAKAEIDIRLVLESSPERLIQLIKQHIKNQGYYVTDKVPTKVERMAHEKVASLTYKISYQSFRTGFNTEVGLWLRRAMKRAFGTHPVMIRMAGGSIPISPFVNTLKIPAVTVPTVNSDNNQHSPNENLRLGNYREGIKTMIAILTERF